MAAPAAAEGWFQAAAAELGVTPAEGESPDALADATAQLKRWAGDPTARTVALWRRLAGIRPQWLFFGQGRMKGRPAVWEFCISGRAGVDAGIVLHETEGSVSDDELAETGRALVEHGLLDRFTVPQ